jgi:hypothetical protein
MLGGKSDSKPANDTNAGLHNHNHNGNGNINGNGNSNAHGNGNSNRNGTATNGAHNGNQTGPMESDHLRMNKMGLEDTQDNHDPNTLKRKRDTNNPLEQ